MILIYDTLFLKELDNPMQIISNKYNLPNIIKYIIYVVKKTFCVLTIKENNLCVLPYKHINNKFIIKVITKILLKTTKKVTLSKYLEKSEYLKQNLTKNGIHIYNGKILSNYLLYSFIEYISKMKKEDVHKQEIFMLINNPDEITKNNIVYLSKYLKRITIVTNHHRVFEKIEKYLEDEMGIGLIITNNKRKSLAKAKIIINLDFDEEMINKFNINPYAIIININNNVAIKSKLFSGINVYNYQIKYKEFFENEWCEEFDKNLLYETTLANNNYNEIMYKISKDNVQIVNLIGKNGIIDKKEYLIN